MAGKAKKEKLYEVIHKAGLNLREKPSLQAKVIRVLTRGEIIRESGESAPEGWISVDSGFVMREYIKAVE